MIGAPPGGAQSGWRGELRACFAIVAHAVRRRRSLGSLWLSWSLLGICALGGALALAGVGSTPHATEAFVLISGGAFSLFALSWWVHLTFSVMEQYTPAAARLLPRSRERMSAVVVSYWLLAVLGATVLVGVTLGHPVLAFFVAGFALVEGVLAGTWRGFLWPALFMLLGGGDALPPSIEAALYGPAGMLAGLGILAFEGRAAHRMLFGVRGQLPPQRPMQLAVRLPLALPQGAKVPDTPAARLAFGLGRPLRLCSGSLVFALSAAAMMSLLGQGWSLWLEATRAIVLGALLLAQLFAADALVGMVYRSHSEQRLLRLAPRVPDAARLNRELARVLLLPLGAMYVLSAAVAVLVFVLTGAGWQAGMQAAAIFLLSPFTAGFVLCDYARPRRHGFMLNLCLAAAGIAGGAMAISVSFGHATPSTMAAAALASLLAATCFAVIRWRRMVHAPVAFPAGRLP